MGVFGGAIYQELVERKDEGRLQKSIRSPWHQAFYPSGGETKPRVIPKKRKGKSEFSLTPEISHPTFVRGRKPAMVFRSRYPLSRVQTRSRGSWIRSPITG